MKKILSILLVAMLMLSCMSVIAQESSIRVRVDGKEIEFDVAPLLQNNRVLVPMRFIFEALGAQVDWEENIQTATGKKDDITVKIGIGDNFMSVNDVKFELDQPAIVQNGRTLVPVRAISESLKCDVAWDESKRMVVITSKQPDVVNRIASYFLTANAFTENLGTFKVETNAAAYDSTLLVGMANRKPEESKNAQAKMEVEEDGEYAVWGRARDYATNQPGTRKLQLKVDTTVFDTEIGNHGEEGFRWQKVGELKLKKGEISVEIVDSAAFYGRIDAVFITNDKNILPFEDYEKMRSLAPPLGAFDPDNMILPIELSERGGLPNFFSKIKEGKEINIGYIGGSQTQAEGYRVKSFEWFKSQYPNAKFSLVSAGVSGTGTDLGALRLHQDIISKDCDLVFIEFSGNDIGRSKASIQETIEGMVRQLWINNPNTDVVFLYTLRDTNVNYAKQGKYHPEAEYMDEVAKKYDIPSIFLSVEAVKMLVNDELVFRTTGNDQGRLVFTSDGVHPTDAGYQIYTEAIARSMILMEKNAQSKAHVIPEALVSARFEKVVMLDPRQANPSSGWTFKDSATDSLAKAYSYMFDGFLRAEKPGESLKFKFKGTSLGIYDVGGPETGQLIVKVDGEEFLLERFTVHSFRSRPQYIFISKTFEDKVHEVEIILGDKQADKISIMKNQNQTYTKEVFDKTVVNIGKILVVGEIIKE